MKFSVKQLKRLIREAVFKTNLGDRVRKFDQRSAVINNISIRNNDKETIKNKLIAELQQTYRYSDMTNEDEMHNILFEDAEFVLNEFVDGDIEDEIRSVFTKKQINALIETWQTQKIDMLLANIDKMPKSLRLQLRGYA